MAKKIKAATYNAYCIWYDQKPEKLFPKDISVKYITSYNEYENEKWDDAPVDSPIIILAELGGENWKHWSFSDFKGFGILTDLRLNHKILNSTVICSTQDEPKEKDIFKMTIGHYFVKLDIKMEKLNLAVYSPISKYDLIDVPNLVLTQNMVSERIHSLYNDLNINTSIDNAEIEQRLNEIKNFISPVYHEKYDKISKEIIDEKINQASLVKKYEQIIVGFSESINNTANQKNIDTSTAPWKAIYIDDDEKYLKIIKEAFLTRNIVCNVYTTAQDIVNYFENNKKDKHLPLLIVDHRLYDENKKFQIFHVNNKSINANGLSVIEAIKSIYTYPQVVVYLSGKEDTMRRAVEKKLPFPIRFYHKDYVFSKDDSSMNVFIDSLIQDAEKAFLKSKTIPEAGCWGIVSGQSVVDEDYIYTKLYREHLISDDYKIAESVINNKVLSNLSKISLWYSINENENINDWLSKNYTFYSSKDKVSEQITKLLCNLFSIYRNNTTDFVIVSILEIIKDWGSGSFSELINKIDNKKINSEPVNEIIELYNQNRDHNYFSHIEEILNFYKKDKNNVIFTYIHNSIISNTDDSIFEFTEQIFKPLRPTLKIKNDNQKEILDSFRNNILTYRRTFIAWAKIMQDFQGELLIGKEGNDLFWGQGDESPEYKLYNKIKNTIGDNLTIKEEIIRKKLKGKELFEVLKTNIDNNTDLIKTINELSFTVEDFVINFKYYIKRNKHLFLTDEEYKMLEYLLNIVFPKKSEKITFAFNSDSLIILPPKESLNLGQAIEIIEYVGSEKIKQTELKEYIKKNLLNDYYKKIEKISNIDENELNDLIAELLSIFEKKINSKNGSEEMYKKIKAKYSNTDYTIMSELKALLETKNIDFNLKVRDVLKIHIPNLRKISDINNIKNNKLKNILKYINLNPKNTNINDVISSYLKEYRLVKKIINSKNIASFESTDIVHFNNISMYIEKNWGIELEMIDGKISIKDPILENDNYESILGKTARQQYILEEEINFLKSNEYLVWKVSFLKVLKNNE